MWNEKIQDMILYEDKEILVSQKPPGLAVQSAGVGKADMESCLKIIWSKAERSLILALSIAWTSGRRRPGIRENPGSR